MQCDQKVQRPLPIHRMLSRGSQQGANGDIYGSFCFVRNEDKLIKFNPRFLRLNVPLPPSPGTCGKTFSLTPSIQFVIKSLDSGGPLFDRVSQADWRLKCNFHNIFAYFPRSQSTILTFILSRCRRRIVSRGG